MRYHRIGIFQEDSITHPPNNLVMSYYVNEWVASNRILLFAQRFLGSPGSKHCNNISQIWPPCLIAWVISSFSCRSFNCSSRVMSLLCSSVRTKSKPTKKMLLRTLSCYKCTWLLLKVHDLYNTSRLMQSPRLSSCSNETEVPVPEQKAHWSRSEVPHKLHIFSQRKDTFKTFNVKSETVW